jgi:hypothetical protein
LRTPVAASKISNLSPKHKLHEIQKNVKKRMEFKIPLLKRPKNIGLKVNIKKVLDEELNQ